MNDDIDSLQAPFDEEKRAELNRMAEEQRQREFDNMIALQRKHR